MRCLGSSFAAGVYKLQAGGIYNEAYAMAVQQDAKCMYKHGLLLSWVDQHQTNAMQQSAGSTVRKLLVVQY